MSVELVRVGVKKWLAPSGGGRKATPGVLGTRAWRSGAGLSCRLDEGGGLLVAFLAWTKPQQGIGIRPANTVANKGDSYARLIFRAHCRESGGG